MSTLILAAALALPLAPSAALQEPPREQEPPQVLLRAPADLPRAEPGRWEAWRPQDAVPQELQAELQAAARAYFLRADYPEALRVLYGLLERVPDYPPALYQAGSAAFRLRRYGDGAELFGRFLAAAPSQVGATQALGHCHYSLGDYERARDHYEAVLAANPEAVEALRGLALSHVRLGDLERGLELLDRVLEARADDADAHAWRAQVLFDLERTEEALAAARRARELAPFEPRPHFLLGQLLHELGRAEEAEAARARFAELSVVDQKVRTLEGDLLADPRRVDLVLRLIDLQRAIGNGPGVREAVERLLRAAPDDLAAHVHALDLMVELQDRAAASQVAARIEERFADQAEAWRRLRDYYGAIGDRMRQVQAGERHLRLGGDPRR